MTTLEVIGGKWKPGILWALEHGGVMRFGAIKRALPGITQKMLTLQLRELEADQVISREVFAEVPPRVEYQLAQYGWTLTPLLEEMAKWGIAHQSIKLEVRSIVD